MKTNYITGVVKRPGVEAKICRIENSLSALQALVGGYIESVTLADDCVILCNEDGWMLGLEHNLEFCGIEFIGPIVVLGTEGEEFVSLKPDTAEWVAEQLDRCA